ncbi:hypothetical protein TWF192_002541 [Orbilia oligospora]|uniref:Uncharacterized protein n=1 Tax=Orbilia oligospora TaxID=2813651 RepID=A0A6G1LSF5_ORBOL|nr:hypothetical protein TWF191_003228 [Orbilia oligospora]KAF3233081.1 hypothetical protein TWF192_002541 [Orbilia oligospora]
MLKRQIKTIASTVLKRNSSFKQPQPQSSPINATANVAEMATTSTSASTNTTKDSNHRTGPPVEEPPGYEALPHFVKSRWENNDYYVEQFADDPWYPVIKDTHEGIKRLVPNYNIVQIKEKFNGLRYYIDFPFAVEPANGYTVEEIHDRIREYINYAEAWVDGFEHAQEVRRRQERGQRGQQQQQEEEEEEEEEGGGGRVLVVTRI